MVKSRFNRRFRAAAIASALLAAGAARAQSIDFAAAVQRALTANPEAVQSAAATTGAAAGVQAARGARLPHVDFSVNAARSNDPLQVFGYRLSQRSASFRDFGLGEYAGPGSLDTTPAALDRPGYAVNYNTGLAVTMPLYSGGRERAGVRAAEARLTASREQQALTRARLMFEVLRSYEGVFAARDMATAAQQARTAAERYLKTAEQQRAQDLALKSDVLTARAHHAGARADEQAARAAVANAEERFRVTIGAERRAGLVPGAAVQVQKPRGSLDEMEARALRANRHIAALRARLEAGRAGVDSARAANWPQVNLTLRHDWNAATPALHAASNTIVASVQWNLFSAGTRQAAVAEAESARRGSAAALRAAEDQVRLDVARRYRAANTADAKVAASEETRREAAEAARLVGLRYRQGIAALSDVLDAQARLDRARADAVQARYDALLTRAELRLTLNELNPAAVHAAPPAPNTANASGREPQ